MRTFTSEGKGWKVFRKEGKNIVAIRDHSLNFPSYQEVTASHGVFTFAPTRKEARKSLKQWQSRTLNPKKYVIRRVEYSGGKPPVMNKQGFVLATCRSITVVKGR